MKELSIEQKAKAYDKAVINGSRLWECGEITRENYEYIFPELKESDDERIRKHLISLFEKFVTLGVANECETSEIKIDNILSWLEKQGKENPLKGTLGDVFDDLKLGINPSPKQGEHKSVDKVEPKFKAGDWIVFNGFTLYVKEVVKGYYRTISKGGIVNSHDWDIDNVARFWNIQDAKDGDVLTCENGWTCIFKTLVNDETFSSYCFMNSTKWFCETGSECHTLKEKFVKAYNGKIYPATKEQRDLLFQKMKEAGYEWDAEKKELNKIYQKSAWSEEDEYCIHQLIVFCENCMQPDSGAIRCANWLKSLKDRVLPKPIQKWSKFDDQMLEAVLYDAENALGERHKEWIKSLKDRVQPKQEWSEEDKTIVDSLLDVLYRIKKGKDPQATTRLIEQHINFIKSLKERYTWKPRINGANSV